MDKETFRRLGYSFIDWIAEYQENVSNYPVASQITPGDIRSRLPKEPPSAREPMEAIFEDFQKIILPGITHWQHPNWFAYFPANNSPPSVLGELLTAAIGAQCMIWKTSPAAAELEEVVLDWLKQMLGLPKSMEGVIQDTASTATLCALITAREKATNFKSNEKGFEAPLTVYTSEETHSSIEKGVKIAGYGRENLRLIPTDNDFALIPEKLEEAIRRDKEQGMKPACVVATLGTTSSTAIDPLAPIAEICDREGVWLHVDAAFAGAACILPEMQWMLEGADKIDSFVFNPHKWLLTNFDCSAYFVSDAEALTRTFEIHPEYLKTGIDATVKNFRDWGIPLGRRFRALKLWFVLRYYGVQGLQSMLREHIRLARMFKTWVESDDRFELMAPVPLSLVCFRLNDGSSEERLDEMNRSLLERINEGGKIFLTHTTLRDRYALRMAIGQRSTGERHVREAWEWITSLI
ncbi:pyridoxal phosphate-dependent decarboxylase family protein [Acidobacteriota bacterium]